MLKLVFSRLGLRSLMAVLAGAAVVMGFGLLLSSYAGAQPEHPAIAARVNMLPFPKNEKMLNDVSAQLARDAQHLSQIAPAAGDAAPVAPKK